MGTATIPMPIREIKPAKISEKNLLKYLSSIEKYHAKKFLNNLEDNRKYFKTIEYSLST